jgi:DUF1680 family protein
MKNLIAILLVLALFSCGDAAQQVCSIAEVPFTDVHFNDRFWAPRIEINRTVSIPSAFHQCEINGRFDNFALAGGLVECEHQGDFPFDDTDPYKIIEGASYSLAVKYDDKLDNYLDSVITLIAAAQESDGYLTTCVTNRCTRLERWWGTHRWERINSHELYNSGHLYEAAVAHFKATGKRSLLDVALKNADLVCRTFGLGEGQIKYPSGHPIIEMALVKLYNVTREKKYLDQARYFVDEAGRLSNGRLPGIYSQDHKPVMEQDEIVGHAVRAGYFYSGVTDVAMLQHDDLLLDAVKRVWDNMAGRKLYITGGIGSRAQGEGFGPDFELNNFNNYCETCASIANVYWNYRLFRATGEAKYIDVLERTLYNGVIAGVSLDGDKFFYDNPLASGGGHNRREWFGCACCPGNITRFMASVPGYAYAVAGNKIYVNIYAEGNAVVKLAQEGAEVEITQKTQYPWDGNVEISIAQNQVCEFELLLRLPGWAKGRPVPSELYSYIDGKNAEIKITINEQPCEYAEVDGYAVIKHGWQAGDRLKLHLDMPVRRVRASDSVEYDRGLLSMERGPIVYALESIDQQDEYLFDVVIAVNSLITDSYDNELLNGVTVLEGYAEKITRSKSEGQIKRFPFVFKAIPYSTWNNRGRGQLVVWTPERPDDAVIKPEETIASRARQIGGYGMNDLLEPRSSGDINTPYHYWWQKAGTSESVEYKFDHPEKVSAVEVYWLEFDHYDLSYHAPESWRLFYSKGTEWIEVSKPTDYGIETDKYNRVSFEPVVTTGLKIEAQLKRSGDVVEASASHDSANTTVAEGAADGSAAVADTASSSTSTSTSSNAIATNKRGYSGGIIEWRVFN